MAGAPKRWVFYAPQTFELTDPAVAEQWTVGQLLAEKVRGGQYFCDLQVVSCAL